MDTWAEVVWIGKKAGQEVRLGAVPQTLSPETWVTPVHCSAKKRKPAWTDRILWKVKAPSVGPSPSGRESHRLKVTQYSYRSHMEYTVSDHKPVAAQFILQVSPGFMFPS